MEKHRFSLQKGLESLQDENFDEAIENFKGGLAGIENDKSPMVRSFYSCVLGWCYINIANYSEGFRLLYKSLMESSNNPDVYFILNILFNAKEMSYVKRMAEKNQLSNIKKDFDKKNDSASHIILSLLGCLKGDLEFMEKHLILASELDPKNTYLFYYRAKCYILKKNYEKALNLFDKIDISRDFFFDYFCSKSTCYSSLILDSFREGHIENAKKFLVDSIKFIHDTKVKLKDRQKLKKYFALTIDEFEQRALLFHKLFIPFDIKFQKIFEAKTLVSFLESLLDVYEFIITRKRGKEIIYNYKKLIQNKEKGIIDVPIIVGFIKGYCVLSLAEHFKFAYYGEAERHSINTKYIKFPKFEFCRKQLLDLGFIKGKQAIDAIETFVSVLSRTKREEMLLKEKELVAMLKPAYVLDGELSKYLAENEFKEDRFKSFKEVFQQTQRESTAMVLGEIKSYFKSFEKEITSSKGPASGKEKPENERMKIPKEIEVDFSIDGKCIKFDGKEIRIAGECIFFLLEDLINRKILHWSWGLVIFDEWQKRIPADPVKQFGMRVRRFNDDFGFKLIDYSSQEKKKGQKEKRTQWTLIKDIIIKSSIRESNSLLHEAEKQKNPQVKLKLLDQALSLYPNSIGAITLLVNFLQNNLGLISQDKVLEGKILRATYDALAKRREMLKGAIEIIDDKMEKTEKCPSYWREVKSHSYKMRNEFTEIEAILNVVEKFLKDQKVTPNEDELNRISEEWKLLAKLAKGDQVSTEANCYKELFEQNLKRPVVKEILNKISSKVRSRIADIGLRDEPKDIMQEVYTHYLILIREGYFTRRNFRNMEELKGTLIKGLSLKITDLIIKRKYPENAVTEGNLREIREISKAVRDLRNELSKEPNDNEILKKLGPQWDKEKLEKTYELKEALFKDEKHIDIEKAQEFIDEYERYEKDYRESIEQSIES